MTLQPVRPEEGVSTHHFKARATAKTKVKALEAKAQEAPNGAKEHGEKVKAKYRHSTTPSGNGAKELKTHSGHRA